MPATEQTWRDLKLMHFVFGLSTLAMLITTIWMLAADHNREWKKIQNTTQRIDDWNITARVSEEKTQRFEQERQRLEQQLQKEQLKPPSQDLIDAFLADALYDKYLASKGGRPAADDPLVKDQAALAAVPLRELSKPENRALLTRVLEALKKQSGDDTGITQAYEQVVAAIQAATPAQTAPPVASKSPTPKPADGEKAAEPPAAELIKPALQGTPAGAEVTAKNLEQVVEARQKLVDRMRAVIAKVNFVEDDSAVKRKMRRSYYDAVKSELDIGVRDGLSSQQMAEFQQRIDAIRAEINDLTLRYEQAATQRRRLEELLKAALRNEDLAGKNLVDYNAEVAKLEESLKLHTHWWNALIQSVQEMPILDGFSPRLKIEQIWLPKLTINNNFRDVARFDRCITCHQQIDKSGAVSASDPAFPIQEPAPVMVELPTPATRPEIARPPADMDFSDQQFNSATQQIYGLRIAQTGMLDPADVTIEVVWPETPTAKVGLLRGDVITHIRVGARDEKILNRQQALRYLVSQVNWGKPITLTLRRGMPHPFATHPRLDLFMGSLSPHKMQLVGCTICHQGQGSGTSFQFSSHSPNSLRQESEWGKMYGYSPNHHWIFPMYPKRFIESTCLKCHHDVVDLEPSQRFPDPPAPKVVAGYKLISQMGCFGCHEITGFDGPKSIGPDMRAEPMYYAAGAALEIEVPRRLPEFEKLRDQAADGKKISGASLEQLWDELGKLQEKAAQTQAGADLKAVEAKEAEIAAATFQKSIDDVRDIVAMAHTIAQHPKDTPVRLRLLESLSIDAARSGAPDKLLTDPAVTPEMFALAQEIAGRPNDIHLRIALSTLLKQAQKNGDPPLRKETFDLQAYLTRPPVLTAAAQKLADQVKTVEGPGTFRKVGPSLRHVAGKLGPGTLNRWIFNPQSIRASTKMPRFFGIHAGLTEDARHTAALYEPIEARAMAQYLMDHSRPLEDLPAPLNVTESASAERGKLLFQTRGCLACHKQGETPQADSTFGPDLTGLGTKLRTENGSQWLVSWLRDPKRYHLRTAMPNLLLDPLPLLGEDGKAQRTAEGKTRMTDPPADIAAYLLGPEWAPVADPFTTFAGGDSSPSADEPALSLKELDNKLAEYLKKWLPDAKKETLREYAATGVPAEIAEKLPGHAQRLIQTLDAQKNPQPIEEATKREIARAMALDTLVQEYLLTVFPVARAREYLHKGIPQDVLPSLKGAEVELAAPIDDTKKLNYVGRRAIGKFGCTGCHDVPGFESARPIGTGLADWGRKETSKLAFEHILEFLPKEQATRLKKKQEKNAQANGHGADHSTHAEGAHAHLNPEAWGSDGFFIESLMHEQREGFLWQKLRQPRSYDYEKTENKTYNEWLRMPQFNLTEAQREQIMTFVLGLVSEPPAAQYVFHPDARQAAVIRGEKTLATFNCQGCHVLQTGEWKIAYQPGAIEPVLDSTLPPFLRHHATPEERLASLNLDRRGLLSGTVHGMMKIGKEGLPEVSRFIKSDPDSDGEFMRLADLEGQTVSPTAPWGHDVEMWNPSVLSGAVVYPKDPLPILASALLPKNPLIKKEYPVRGGDFARLLLPIAIATQKQGEGADAWAWVPPPLVGQGKKTQEKWLHDFLLDPYSIRPGVILRMPKFNMSSEDSESLVQYFVARDNAEYPNMYGAKDTVQRLSAAEKDYQETLRKEGKTGTRFGDAEKIVLNKSGCIKCHLVGNFKPDGNDRALAPNLADVYRRLQPDYVHRWIAKPSLILPYTKMPINFPYDPANKAQDGFWDQIPGTMQNVQVYHGDSLQQVQAVSDLLSNWDRFIEGQTSIRKKVEATGGAAPPAGRAP